MPVLIAAGGAAIVAVLLAWLFARRRRAAHNVLPEEGLTEEDVATLQRKQRTSERSVRVRRDR